MINFNDYLKLRCFMDNRINYKYIETGSGDITRTQLNSPSPANAQSAQRQLEAGAALAASSRQGYTAKQMSPVDSEARQKTSKAMLSSTGGDNKTLLEAVSKAFHEKGINFRANFSTIIKETNSCFRPLGLHSEHWGLYPLLQTFELEYAMRLLQKEGPNGTLSIAERMISSGDGIGQGHSYREVLHVIYGWCTRGQGPEDHTHKSFEKAMEDYMNQSGTDKTGSSAHGKSGSAIDIAWEVAKEILLEGSSSANEISITVQSAHTSKTSTQGLQQLEKQGKDIKSLIDFEAAAKGLGFNQTYWEGRSNLQKFATAAIKAFSEYLGPANSLPKGEFLRQMIAGSSQGKFPMDIENYCGVRWVQGKLGQDFYEVMSFIRDRLETDKSLIEIQGGLEKYRTTYPKVYDFIYTNVLTPAFGIHIDRA